MRYYSNTAVETTLASSTTSSATMIYVSDTTGFPATTPFTLGLDVGTGSEELVSVTEVAGTTLTVTRGFDSTTAQSHSAGAVVKHMHSAIDFREAQEHAAATSDVHGVSGSLVGTTAEQTVSNKTLDSSNTFPATLAPKTYVDSQVATRPTSADVDNKVSTHAADSDGVHGVAAGSSVVGTGDTQTLTNKDLTAESNTLPYGARQVRGAVETTGSVDLTGSAQAVLAIDITIPADWNSYDVEFGFTVQVNGSSPAQPRALNLYAQLSSIRLTPTFEQSIGAGSSFAPRDLVTITGTGGGLTTTGARRLEFMTWLQTADSYTATNRNAWVRAVRRS